MTEMVRNLHKHKIEFERERKLQFISAQYSDMLDSVYTLNLIHKGTYSN